MNGTPRRPLDFRPRRWLVHIALAFGAGVLLGLRVPPHPLWIAGAGLAALLLAMLLRGGRSPYPAVLCLALLAGLLRCAPAAHPALPEEGVYHIEAEISGEARRRETDGRVAVYLKNARLEGAGGSFTAYWTYWPEEEDGALPVDGQAVAFTGKVYHPAAQSNPHGFDFRLFLLQRGVRIGVSGSEEAVFTPEEQTAPRSPLLRLRQAVRERLRLLLGEDGAVAQALLLNDKSDMPEEMLAGFREVGVAHVLAVSGLHVMILFGCITVLLRRFSPSQAFVTAVSAALLGLYCLLAGAQAAALRAGLLMLYLQGGRILRRRADRLTGLAAAFLIILLLRPLDLFSAGFQLSFGAVLGLILLGDRVSFLLRGVRGGKRRVLRAYGMTLSAVLGTLLPVGWYFHRLPLLGLLASPPVTLAVTGLMPLLLILLLVSALWLSAGSFLGRGVAFLCRGLTRAVQALAALLGTGVQVPRLPLWAMAAVAAGMILCTRYVRLRARARLILGGALLTLTAAALMLTRNRDARYIQLDMGSADAAVIEDGRETVVIDAGEDGSELAAYLLSTGRGADTLILTHLHADHVLGLNELLDGGVRIGEICLSTEALVTPAADNCLAALERAQAAGIPIRTLCAGDSLGTRRVRIDVAWPERGGAVPAADANDFALVLRVDLDGITLLQMSDVSGAYECYCAQPANVLKVAHHGSAASTGERFLALVRPEIALLSTRKASGATLERLAEAGVMVYDTSKRGALTLTAHGGEARIQGFLR